MLDNTALGGDDMLSGIPVTYMVSRENLVTSRIELDALLTRLVEGGFFAAVTVQIRMKPDPTIVRGASYEEILAMGTMSPAHRREGFLKRWIRKFGTRTL